jgi:hypothetical protein
MRLWEVMGEEMSGHRRNGELRIRVVIIEVKVFVVLAGRIPL